MIQFIKNFLYEGFIPGDYTYGFIHTFSIVFLITSIVVVTYLWKDQDSEYIHNKLKSVAIFTLVIYFLRRGMDIYQGREVVKALWPFYICNVNTVFMSLLIIFNVKKGKDFFMITGLAGAVLMFVVPEGVFNDKYLTLQIFDSLLSHYAIIFMPMVLMLTKAYKLDIRNSWQVILGLLLVLLNVEYLQRFLVETQVDYLFLDGTLPFTIDGVPQVYIMFGSALVFVYVIYGINYLYNQITLNVLSLEKATTKS